MKFKNDKLDDARSLRVTDRYGDELRVILFVDQSWPQVIVQTGSDVAVGMTRAKLRKIAQAILVEVGD